MHGLKDIAMIYNDNEWPNDIYFGDKKLSGTLSECTLHNTWINEFIAGVGINVNQLVFHSDAPNPVSMANISGHTFDRNALLDDIAKEISHWFEIGRASCRERV